MPLETNFDAAPYFDDYSESKNFHRVMFKPAVAVQARELTQMQTILQNQVEKFGKHVFKDGTVVAGCTINFDPRYDYVQLLDLTAESSSINVDDYLNCKVFANSGLEAYVVNVADGLESDDPDLKTLYIKYLNTGTYASNSASQKTFDPGEFLQVRTAEANTLIANIVAANTANAIGTGYAMSVTEGTVFHKGFFISVPAQTILVEKYSTSPNNVTAGFTTLETITTADADTTLFDNAFGSSNENAPGADRLKLAATLVVRATPNTSQNTSTSNTTNFFALADFEEGRPVSIYQDTQYAKLGAEMARRTYEESGNYIVDPFELSVAANSANQDLLVLEIDRGVGYVQGFRVEIAAKNRKSMRKGTDSISYADQVITAGYGNYVICDEFAGLLDIDSLDQVQLRSSAGDRVTTNNYASGPAAPGSLIGTAHVRDIQYHSGVPGTPTAQYRVYLFDIHITAVDYDFTDVRSLYAEDAGGRKGYCDTVLESGLAVLKDTSSVDLVFPLGRTAVKTLNTAATSFQYRAKATATFEANGAAVVDLSTLNPAHTGGSESISQTGSLSEVAENAWIVIANTSANSVNASFTVSTTASQSNVTGSGSTFTTSFAVGDWVVVANSTASEYRQITSITNATHLAVSANFANSFASANVARHFPNGGLISFQRDDSANVSVAGATANLYLGCNLASTMAATALFNVTRTGAVHQSKTINRGRFVVIDCSNNATRNIGPWCLGIPDVFRIVNIWQGATAANTETLVTSNFVLNNGQTGSHYDLATIAIKPGSGHSVTTAQKLLVELDHFVLSRTNGIGYFSLNSYPIDDANTSNTAAIRTAEVPVFVSPQSGHAYDLRDSIDFRPYAVNTAVSNTTIASATINPSSTFTANVDGTSGAYMVTPDSNFQTDFEYYLGRRDKVAITSAGKLTVIEGAPALAPKAPRDLEGSMTLGTINVPPYPSLDQASARTYSRADYGVSVALNQYRRYTMRDIGAIDSKLSRLEYYTSLSLLEASAKTLLVKDDTGAERFKNGFVVDPFKGFTVADTASPEFRAAIDYKQQEMAPTISRQYCDMVYDSANSTSMVKNGSVITLAHTTVPYIQQPFASKYRNCVENTVYVWRGNITLTPEGDQQPDIDYNPDIVANIDLSGLTDLVNGLPNLIGVERIVATSTQLSDRTTEVWGGTQRDVSATTTTSTQRTDTDLSATTVQNTFDFGDVVQDISIQQFIRASRVQFAATGMKRGTTVYPFFDGVDVTAYCTPANSSYVATGAKGDPLVVDASGQVYGIFDIPAGQFKTGDRVFQLADVDDLVTGANAITTQAAASYSASNITITKAKARLATRLPQISTNAVTADRVIVQDQLVSSQFTETVWPDDPIAQTFMVNEPSTTAGVMIKQIDCYFQKKDTVLGVELQVREVENGYPSPRIVPFGRKRLTSADVTVSEDASEVTSFAFDSPIILEANKEYCFVVLPEGNNTNYNIWVGELGGTDVTTNTPIFTNNFTGVMFTSSTNRAWTAFQKEDIKFVVHRAAMSATSGTIKYHNDDSEYLTANNFRGVGFLAGEQVYVSNGVVVLASNASITNGSLYIAVGNASVNAANQSIFANGYIWVSSNSGYYTDVRYVNSAASNGTHLAVTTALSFTDSNAVVGYIHAGAANSALFGYMQRTTGNSYIHLANSTANATVGFTNVVFGSANALLIGAESRSRANLVSVDSISYSTVVPQFAYVSPGGTSTKLCFAGTPSGSYTIETALEQMTSDIETHMNDKVRVVHSRSLELENGSGEKSVRLEVPVTTDNAKLSPTFDDIKSAVVLIKNIITTQAGTGDETKEGGDTATAKYISKRVVLADGQDAEDLTVLLSAYKPSGTEIEVYAKFLNGEDNETMDEKAWTLLTQNTATSVVSSRVDRNDFREFQYILPTMDPTDLTNFTSVSFLSNNDVDTTNNTIALANASSTFTPGDFVLHIGISLNEVVNNTHYSVASSNDTHLQLSASYGGAVANLTANGTNSTSYLYLIPRTAYKDSTLSDVVSYHTRTGAYFTGFKTFALKIVMSTEEGSHLVPRVADMRAIALQI